MPKAAGSENAGPENAGPDGRASPTVEVFVLAGGQSSRMGVPKAELLVDGTPLISTVVSAVRHLGPQHIIGGPRSLIDLVRTGEQDSTHAVTHRKDEVDNPGPFGAIVSALRELRASEALVVSCDLALLTRDDVARLVMQRRSTDADIAVPVVAGRRQWHAIALSERIVPALLARHADGVRSLWRGFSGFSECLVVSKEKRFFLDVDTPEDVEALNTSV